MTKNILMCGVGGQGLVLMTKIISEVALKEGFNFKTNDIVGLSQRGGMVWGTVKIGDNVLSPNISKGEVDYVLALEPLEGLRWSFMLKPTGKIFVNDKEIFPTVVQQTQEAYPYMQIEEFYKKENVIKIEATKIAEGIGNTQVINIILLGMFAKDSGINKKAFEETLIENLKQRHIEINLKAFNLGYDFNY